MPALWLFIEAIGSKNILSFKDANVKETIFTYDYSDNWKNEIVL